MTFKQLYKLVKQAQGHSSDSGFYDRASYLGIVIFGLDSIYRRSLSDVLMIAVNEYDEFVDAIITYVNRDYIRKQRKRDLVLETLREAAEKRFQKIESVFNEANYYFNDDVRNALKSLFH